MTFLTCRIFDVFGFSAFRVLSVFRIFDLRNLEMSIYHVFEFLTFRFFEISYWPFLLSQGLQLFDLPTFQIVFFSISIGRMFLPIFQVFAIGISRCIELGMLLISFLILRWFLNFDILLVRISCLLFVF